VGATTGTLTLSSSTLAALVTVPLAGTGFDFTVANTGSLTQTVASGTTATYTLTLTPSSGSGATFTFQCNSLPVYATCTFNPVQNTVAANSTGTEAIKISTSQASAQLMRPAPFGWSAGAVMACGILLVPFTRRRKRLFLVLLAAVGLFAFTSCSSAGGGGGGTTPSGPGTNNTAAGTYSIPVVIGANGEQHTVTLTLVVD
jgi:hypothetical protein